MTVKIAERYKIRKEDGSSRVSLSNVVRLASMHGPPVGALHRISVTDTVEDRSKHSTIIFFHDGHTHECKGLASGQSQSKDEKEKAEHEKHVGALKVILQMIPLVAIRIEGDLVQGLGMEPEAKEAWREKQTRYYIIRPAFDLVPDLDELRNCSGSKEMDMFIEKIATEDNTVSLWEGW